VINNKLSEIIVRRRSIREYSAEGIDIDIIKSIIDTASHALKKLEKIIVIEKL